MEHVPRCPYIKLISVMIIIVVLQGVGLIMVTIIELGLMMVVVMAKHEKWLEFLSPFEVLPITQDVTWQYGQIYQKLSSIGKIIGTNDLWIAATALAHSVPVATNNVREFSRVKGLEVISV